MAFCMTAARNCATSIGSRPDGGSHVRSLTLNFPNALVGLHHRFGPRGFFALASLTRRPYELTRRIPATCDNTSSLAYRSPGPRTDQEATMTEPDTRRLRRLGISPPQLHAIRKAWAVPALRDLLNRTAVEIQAARVDPLDALDVVWHDLPPTAAVTIYLRKGFTPHQAYLLATSDRAQENLFGSPSGADVFDELDAIDMPRDILTSLLLAAESPDEARHFMNETTRPEDPSETDDDRDRLVAIWETIEERAQRRTDTCDCPR